MDSLFLSAVFFFLCITFSDYKVTFIIKNDKIEKAQINNLNYT